MMVSVSFGVVFVVVAILSGLAGAWLGANAVLDAKSQLAPTMPAEPSVPCAKVVRLLLEVADFQQELAEATRRANREPGAAFDPVGIAEAEARWFAATVLRGVAERVRIGDLRTESPTPHEGNTHV